MIKTSKSAKRKRSKSLSPKSAKKAAKSAATAFDDGGGGDDTNDCYPKKYWVYQWIHAQDHLRKLKGRVNFQT